MLFDVGGYAVDKFLKVLSSSDIVRIIAAVNLGLHAATTYDIKGKGVGIGGMTEVVELGDELGELGELGLCGC